MFGRTNQGNGWQFAADGQTEAVNRLLYLSENGEVLSLLEGAYGTGKSTVLKRTAAELNGLGRRTICQNVAALDCRAVLWHLCGALSVFGETDSGTSELMLQLRNELLARARCQHPTVVLLDDTDLAQRDIDVVLNLMVSIAEASEGGVSVIAATEQPLTLSLHRRTTLSVRLERLREQESIEFAVRRLAHLECDIDRMTETGWRALADLSEGLPAQLLRICRILQVVMSTQPGAVDAAVVHAAARELLPQAA